MATLKAVSGPQGVLEQQEFHLGAVRAWTVWSLLWCRSALGSAKQASLSCSKAHTSSKAQWQQPDLADGTSPDVINMVHAPVSGFRAYISPNAPAW
jgi:hypothetical protein